MCYEEGCRDERSVAVHALPLGEALGRHEQVLCAPSQCSVSQDESESQSDDNSNSNPIQHSPDLMKRREEMRVIAWRSLLSHSLLHYPHRCTCMTECKVPLCVPITKQAAPYHTTLSATLALHTIPHTTLPLKPPLHS